MDSGTRVTDEGSSDISVEEGWDTFDEMPVVWSV